MQAGNHLIDVAEIVSVVSNIYCIDSSLVSVAPNEPANHKQASYSYGDQCLLPLFPKDDVNCQCNQQRQPKAPRQKRQTYDESCQRTSGKSLVFLVLIREIKR